MRRHFIRVPEGSNVGVSSVVMINTDHIVSIHARPRHGQNQTTIEEIFSAGYTLLRMVDGSEISCAYSWDTMAEALEPMEYDHGA